MSADRWDLTGDLEAAPRCRPGARPGGINDGQGHGHVKPRPDGDRARCGGPRRCTACAAELEAAAAEWTQAVAAQQAERDGLYTERAQLVAFVAACFPSVLSYSDPAAPEWAVLTVTTPRGQMCWHIAPADLALFMHVPRVAPGAAPQFDGHTTPQKYARLAAVVGDVAHMLPVPGAGGHGPDGAADPPG